MARININIPYFKEVVSKSHMTQSEFSKSLGQGDAWVRNVLSRGCALENTIKLMCRMYGADYNKLTTPVTEVKLVAPKPDEPPAELVVLISGMVRVERKLDLLLKELGYDGLVKKEVK